MSPERRPDSALSDALGSARRPDPRLSKVIHAALGTAASIANIGAGAGNYEPPGRTRVAVEASPALIKQRPPGSAPVVRARAETVPLADKSVDAALAILTLQHWADWAAGVAELRRIARDRVVIVTWDPDSAGFWLLQDYLPDLLTASRNRFPRVKDIQARLGESQVLRVPIPHDCTDKFLGAYWRRPSAYLDPVVRRAMGGAAAALDVTPLAKLEHDLASGRWDAKNAHLLKLESLDIGYRIVVASAG